MFSSRAGKTEETVLVSIYFACNMAIFWEICGLVYRCELDLETIFYDIDPHTRGLHELPTILSWRNHRRTRNPMFCMDLVNLRC